MTALRTVFLKRTYELYFVELRNKLTALPITVSTRCVTRRIWGFHRRLYGVWSLLTP